MCGGYRGPGWWWQRCWWQSFLRQLESGHRADLGGCPSVRTRSWHSDLCHPFHRGRCFGQGTLRTDRWVGWVQYKPVLFLVCPFPAAPGIGHTGQSKIWAWYLPLGGILRSERKEFMISCSIGLTLASHGLNLLPLLACASYYHKMVSLSRVSPHLLCEVQFNILTAEFPHPQSLQFYPK